MDSVIRDLRYRNVVYGIQMNVLQDHFMSDGIYGTDLIVAKGKNRDMVRMRLSGIILIRMFMHSLH